MQKPINNHVSALEEVAATSEGLIDCKDKSFLLIDVKGIFDRKEAEEAGCLYWRL